MRLFNMYFLSKNILFKILEAWRRFTRVFGILVFSTEKRAEEADLLPAGSVARVPYFKLLRRQLRWGCLARQPA